MTPNMPEPDCSRPDGLDSLAPEVAQQALADSEARFRGLFDSSPIGMAIVGLDGSWLRVNAAVAAIVGYSMEELLRLDFQSITHPDDLETDLHHVRSLVRGEASSYQMHKRYIRRDGRTVWCLLSVALIRDESGNAQHFVSQLLDVNEERRSRELLDVMFASSPDLLLLSTPQGAVLRANASWERVLGWSEAELQGMDVTALIHPEDVEQTVRLTTSVGAGTGAGVIENRYRAKDGSYRWLSWSGAALPGQGLLVASARDVTSARQAQEALARTEQQSRTAFEASPCGMVITDSSNRFVRVNPAFARLVGRSVEDLTGRTFLEVTHAEDRAASIEEVHRVVAGDVPAVRIEKRFVRPDGEPVWARVSVTTLAGPDGERHRLAQVEDISAQHAADIASAREAARLQATIALQRALIALAGDETAIYAAATEGALTLIPRADGVVVELLDGDDLVYTATRGSLRHQTGLRIPVAGSLAGLSSTTGTPLQCHDVETDARVNVEACRRAGIGSMLVAPLFAGGRSAGVLKISAGTAYAFSDADEQQLILLADALTSALRHHAEVAQSARLLAQATDALSALEDSEARFRLAFDSSPLGMVLTGLRGPDRGVFLQANQAMSVITGYRPTDLVGMSVSRLHHPDDLPATVESLAQLESGGTGSLTVDKRYLHAEGQQVWVRIRAAALPGDDGRPLYLVSQIEDITEQRAAALRLQERAQLLDLTQDAVTVCDMTGRVTYWNPAAENVFGWSAESTLGHDRDRLLATSWPAGYDAEQVHTLLVREGRWEGQLVQRRADGRAVTVQTRQALQRDAEGNPVAVLSINTDVTAAQRAERALAESEQRFRAQFTHSAAGQVIRALDGTWLQVNPAFAGMLGTTPDTLEGRNVNDVLHPEDLTVSRRNIAALFAGERESVVSEGRMLREDGSWLDYHSTLSLVRDEDGLPTSMIVVVTDISDRKSAERERDATAAELGQRNRELEAANQLKLDLMGMLGHEIGNPLAAILGYSELALEEWEHLEDPAKLNAVTVIARNAHRLDTLVREVLTMVTVDAGRLTATPHDIAVLEHLQAVLEAARAGHSPTAPTPALSCPPGLRVLVQPGHFEQIVVNLLTNAEKYAGGATAVRAQAAGDRVRIVVEDRGAGVPEEFRPHLFERFSRGGTTDGTVKGTGLGLYIVRELARANGGEVEHTANPGGGSAFVVTLPRERRAG